MGRRGFTLVELLIVLAVGSILLAIAVPGYGFLMNTSRLAAVTNDLVSALQLARSEAIKHGARVTVCKTSNPMAAQAFCDNTANWHEGWLVFSDDGVRGVIDSGDTLLRVQGRLSGGANITSSSPYHYVSYRPSGMSQGSNGLANGTISVCLEGSRRDIIISRAGRIRLNSGTC